MAAAARDTPLPLQGLTALVVEDEADTLDSMLLLLEGLGARALWARDATQALATLEGTAVEVILCDLRLPGVDGFELCARIRRDPRWHRIPTIAMTGLTSPADYHNALEAGFAGHLAKPVQAEVPAYSPAVSGGESWPVG
jgi:CheY-like chemotaxis protein